MPKYQVSWTFDITVNANDPKEAVKKALDINEYKLLPKFTVVDYNGGLTTTVYLHKK